MKLRISLFTNLYLIKPWVAYNENLKLLIVAVLFITLVWFGLVWFYGISTIKVYLMPNPFLYNQTVLFQTIQFSISTQFKCQKFQAIQFSQKG